MLVVYDMFVSCHVRLEMIDDDKSFVIYTMGMPQLKMMSD